MSKLQPLYVTFLRGFAGKGQYQSVLRHLGLTRSGTTVRLQNTFEYRAAVRKVQHLLRVETHDQYQARIAEEHARTRVLNPLHARHVPRH